MLPTFSTTPMTSSNRFISNLFLVCLTFGLAKSPASACVDDPYIPSSHAIIYRVDGNEPTGLSVQELRQRNIQLWHRQTGCSPSLLERLVYESSASDYTRQLSASALASDTASVRLLLIARQCEEARRQIASPWYYAVEGDEPQTTLLTVAEHSERMASLPGKMRQRYVLQAVRARFALRQYAQCLAFWAGADQQVTEPLLRDMILPYIAGCHYHLHQSGLALPIFLHYGDVESVRLCAKMLGDERTDGEWFEQSSYDDNVSWYDCLRYDEFSLMAQYCPDAPDLAACLQRFIDKMGANDNSYFIARWPQPVKPYLESALQASRQSHGRNRALWLYAAAMLSDLAGDTSQSLRLISQIHKLPHSKAMDHYVHLLETSIFFRTAPVNPAYMQRVRQELRWLEERMVNAFHHDGISPSVWDCGIYYHEIPSDDADFWNQALQRLVMHDINSRLESRHDYSTMLQLTNYAENRYLTLCNGELLRVRVGWSFNTITGEYEDCDSIQVLDHRFLYTDYQRPASAQWNANFSTRLFTLADSLPSDVIRRHIQWLEQPHRGFEAMLWRGSNTDMDYWRDILGTHLLREQRFAEAEQVFSHVSSNYYACTNLYREYCFWRDPFAFDCYHAEADHSERYRLRFARRMAMLEQSLATLEGDALAQTMLEFATGLSNSVRGCWSLTAYYHPIDDDSYQVPYAWSKGSSSYFDLILQRSDSLFNRAFETFQSRELKAEALASHNRRLLVMRDLPDTRMAEYLERHCDLWRDYAKAKPSQN